MKNLTIYLLGAVTLLVTACDTNDRAQKSKEDLSDNAIDYGSQVEFKSLSKTYTFPNVPQEVVDKAILEYGTDSLPAVTIALTYTRGDTNIVLEDGWSFYNYSSPQSDCFIGDNIDYQGGQGMLTTENGFVFIESSALCGEGTYIMDNRQGGWFDYVCGPDSFRFDYQGDPVFVLVRLWCE